MQTIDFIKGIGYEIISFPDGEKHLKINKLNRIFELKVEIFNPKLHNTNRRETF